MALASSSVLEITKIPLLSIPDQYVRTELEPVLTLSSTNNNQSLPTIPTIDMAKLLQSETSDLHLQNLHSACKHWGFFQLVNHGVSRSVMEELNQEIEGFFKLPLEEKLKYKIRPGDVEGYGNVVRRDDNKLDWSDRVFMITNPISRRKPHLLPELPSSLKTSVESYIEEMKRLGMRLFGVLAKALKVEEKMLVEEIFEDGMQSVRMTCYPACPEPEKVIGFTPHSDAAGITILHQLTAGVDGLQVKKDGAWVSVNFLPHALVVNIGDVFEILSNGVYKSIEHRVMANSCKERISVAMFFNAKYDSEIGPLPSLVNSQSNDNPPLFKRVGMEDYINLFFSHRKYDGKSFLDLMRTNHTNDINT